MISLREALALPEVWAALDLRRQVFGEGMGLPPEQLEDGRDDPPAVHLLVLEEQQVVGTCRLLPVDDRVKLSWMAVHPDHRGEGLGPALLGLADQKARELGAVTITLNAYAPVVPLYATAGYAIVGEPFHHRGLRHVHMEKDL